MPSEQYKATVAVLDELGLEYQPVAMAVVDSPPTGINEKSQAVSACAFWRAAEAEVFYASSEDHCGCSIGAHVMGVYLPEPTQLELVGSIKLMADVGQLAAQWHALSILSRMPFPWVVPVCGHLPKYHPILRFS